MLEAKNLVKIYKPKRGVPVKALDNVNIKFADKGMVFLLGKSGSGKSTLLNVLGGLDRLNSGEIIIKEVSSKSFRQKHFDSYRNTYLGFIFQEYNILDEFTVGANIALAIELQGRKASSKEISEILEKVDLKGYGARKPNELSGGQKQRVAIARALVKNPQIIMADEPTGALDSNTGRQVLQTLKELSKDKLVIVVSHDREFAENYADRIIELADGKVISDIERAKPDDEKETENRKLNFEGNSVEIASDYRLTEEDRIAINDYLEKLKSGSLKLNIASASCSSKNFKKTDEAKISFENQEPFKLIKSKLPIKSAFKIGASGLKHKKIRLVVTILLCCVSFGLFGLADTFGSYNLVETCTNSLADSGVKYIATAKSKKVKSASSFYWNDGGYSLSNEDLAQIEKKTNIKMHGVYEPLEASLDLHNNIDTEKLDTETGFSIYKTSFEGFAQINDEIMKEMGFEILSGVMPDGSKNEIAISELAFETFKRCGYTDGVLYKDKNGEYSLKYTEIKMFTDLIGKTVVLDSEKYTITAIINTGFDIERYMPLIKKKDYNSNSDALLNIVLSAEFNNATEYAYTGLIMVGDGFIERLIEKRPPMAYMSEGYLYFMNEDKLHIDISANYMAKLEDVKNEKIIWIDGEKTSLGEKEIIVTSDVINAWDEEKTETSESYPKILKGKELTATFDKFVDDKITIEDGYKVVGIIEVEEETEETDEVIPEKPEEKVQEKSKLKYTLICNEKLYNQFTEGKDNYYSFCVGSAPTDKKELKKAVSFFYNEDTSVRYPIQNSVTFELDSLNEILKTLSKVFLYIGLGFAIFAALMLANFISTSISYKKQEIGILRAIGSRSNDVFRIFFSESFIIAMINFVLSAVGVFIATYFINGFFRNNLGILITVLTFDLRQILLLLGVSLIVAFVASYIPVKKIASKRPIDAIRDR
ncbi:MAG: ABC transporter ATP-binding protein/permease [Clostridia bacterium]|nr:ABC transporter ATP-binding protein/permease [Clostridia bacterium]